MSLLAAVLSLSLTAVCSFPQKVLLRGHGEVVQTCDVRGVSAARFYVTLRVVSLPESCDKHVKLRIEVAGSTSLSKDIVCRRNSVCGGYVGLLSKRDTAPVDLWVSNKHACPVTVSGELHFYHFPLTQLEPSQASIQASKSANAMLIPCSVACHSAIRVPLDEQFELCDVCSRVGTGFVGTITRDESNGYGLHFTRQNRTAHERVMTSTQCGSCITIGNTSLSIQCTPDDEVLVDRLYEGSLSIWAGMLLLVTVSYAVSYVWRVSATV